MLVVSKPVAPPLHDGAVCLVHELARHVTRASLTVITTREAPAVAEHVRHARIHGSRGGFAPALRQNARVLAHLLRDRDHDLWHFVFAPNPASSHAGRLAKRARGVPVVQTVASRPLRFEGASRLLFGDRIVALSRHTADRIVADGFPAARIDVIPAPIADLARTDDEQRAARARCQVPAGAPMFLYAGDLETSSGARTFAAAVPAIVRHVPDAMCVIACRAKTGRAETARRALEAELRPVAPHVRFAGEVPDLPALVASAAAFAFPVDELHGKVDLPYALLEACLLRVPVVAARGTPLEELEGALLVAPGDPAALADRCVGLARDAAAARQIGEALRRQVMDRHAADKVAERYEQLYDRIGP